MVRLVPLLSRALVLVLIFTAGCTSLQGPAPGSPPAQETTMAATPPVSAAATANPATTDSGTCPVNIQTDPVNCGACGHVCPPGAVCQGGYCYCSNGSLAGNTSCTAAGLSVTAAGS